MARCLAALRRYRTMSRFDGCWAIPMLPMCRSSADMKASICETTDSGAVSTILATFAMSSANTPTPTSTKRFPPKCWRQAPVLSPISMFHPTTACTKEPLKAAGPSQVPMRTPLLGMNSASPSRAFTRTTGFVKRCSKKCLSPVRTMPRHPG